MSIKLIIAIILSLSCFLPFGQITFAQEPTIIPQQFDPNKIPTLQSVYFAQLESYRSAEDRYIVAKNQYLQLNTLASQELAVAETKQLLSLRSDIFLTYIDILDEMLNQSKGIPLENKNSERVSLSLLKEKVKINKTAVDSALDRFAVDNESKNFEPTYKELQSHTYYILSLIKLGSMQIAYDKLLVTRDAIKTYVDSQELSTAVRAEKQRGFDEIERNITKIDSLFRPIKASVYSTPGKGDLGQYSQLSSQLNPVYAQINQVIQFLKEVKK